MGGAPVLGGRHLKGRHDNQLNDDVGGGGSTGEVTPTNQINANGRVSGRQPAEEFSEERRRSGADQAEEREGCLNLAG